jgi:hypothetical protein
MGKPKKAKITKTYITTEGTLYKDSIVRIDIYRNSGKHLIRVKDELGKIYYVDPTDLVIL